ncbi:hypothetical protein LTR62_007508 [Meristemomyces frigidus]|uniref:RNB domain-containing protein n=1 Tax=Meristemomyces frigidus TaxID=1508187 RepID=A0AAN7YP00_9PEZI|nr:hypothetical protein LTR62_007508 [Meristemomyces frigidus]
MLPVRSAVSRSTSFNSYVCLGCRLRTQKRQRHDAALDADHSVGSETSEGQLLGAGDVKSALLGKGRSARSARAGKPKASRKKSREERAVIEANRRAAKARAQALFDDVADLSGAEMKAVPVVRHTPERQISDGLHGYRKAELDEKTGNPEIEWVGEAKQGARSERLFQTQPSWDFRKMTSEGVSPPTAASTMRTFSKHFTGPSDWKQLGSASTASLPTAVSTLRTIKTHITNAKQPKSTAMLNLPTIKKQFTTPSDSKQPKSISDALGDVLEAHVRSAGERGHESVVLPTSLPDHERWDRVSGLESSRNDSSAMDRLTAAMRSSQVGVLTPLRSIPRAPDLPSRKASLARAYHTNQRQRQTEDFRASGDVNISPALLGLGKKKYENSNGIRAQLRRWQNSNGHEEQNYQDNVGMDMDLDGGESSNNLTRLADPEAALRTTPAEQEEDEREAMAHFMQAPADGPNAGDFNERFLKMGDLVEVEFVRSDTPSIVAIFIRRIGLHGMAQLYTMQGRWLHIYEKKMQYSIPGWVSEDMVRPLLQYLPSPDDVESKLDELVEQSYMRDLSVPREIAAPLVSRMVQFRAEATEIYRKHASTLDNAHALLAHESDLRYGSLVSAATTLLKTPADKLPVTALFAVRQALADAGFAFNIDRRSHRLTGYLQIRSREQVKMVQWVRGWLREWQDDLALTATMSENQLKRHRPLRGAAYVHGFLDKAKKIVAKSREDRAPTPWGNVGPSKVRIPITQTQNSVRISKEECFTDQETEIVRFVEAWSLSSMFLGLPRLEALPPLILQATGLYDSYDLAPATGMLFLQEIGTILPYENRVRFDQHLLLPSSQHSKPLQNLMASLMEMQPSPNFQDSMADLRHDWGNLPVYCIDDASAHEIDDGISIVSAGAEMEGQREWWVHIHIANPTAFFERNHPLAKMARHMGESIYMPERTYMMLPRWATKRHFSLDRNRPCLTFSARMNEKGETLERKIRSGYIRNVLRMTRQEVGEILSEGTAKKPEAKRLVLQVGGESPPDLTRPAEHAEVTEEMKQQLKDLRMLGVMRSEIRKAAGGLFFDSHKPDVKVWQQYRSTGLAWDHPYRKGWRHVEGDPVIRVETQGLKNWFAPVDDAVDVLVRESMLLACEIAATWCEERQIPAVFRGSMPRPDRIAPETYFDTILAPAVKESGSGEYPMHLGMQYLQTFGSTCLSTQPFRHAILGMQHYGKVTSPLRRYGDMILHWQIEATLREEARTGQSLITTDPSASRPFLPFSKPVLDTIILGLQPRESIITRAKSYTENFWITQLLFRAHHFGEIPLPFPNGIVRCYVSVEGPKNLPMAGVMMMELNITARMEKVVKGKGYEEVRVGDVWECEIVGIECFLRTPTLRALRLVERVQ